MACHCQGRADPGVYGRQSTHCQKRSEDLRCWAKKTAEAQLAMASQLGRGARRTLTPLMFHTLAVAYPELDGRLRASQQPEGVSTVPNILLARGEVVFGSGMWAYGCP
ncbi:hypothetical protein NDU88_002895 [Pleurodeles waltl]|uniref:Uncharacterized protein n=1 Tax=Pleurodeles waltl TaxID=8319 RepID=A0AAV7V051_PLEWA|nr:hypothetical protein NDU88_002895 [Pleurodeles waltl]